VLGIIEKTIVSLYIRENKMKPIGKDREGNDLFPGDTVLRDGDIEETIEYGTYREKFDCGYVVGYYIPDYCIKVFKDE
jgi:hypothetical protein